MKRIEKARVTSDKTIFSNSKLFYFPKGVGSGERVSEPLEPTDVDGLAAWFDGADETTLTVDEDNRVSQWNDKSSNGNHASQNTLSNQPVYDDTIQELVFDGDSLLATEDPVISEDWNIYAVFSTNTLNNIRQIISQHPSTGTEGRVVYFQTNEDALTTFFNNGNSFGESHSTSLNTGQNYLAGSFQAGADTYLSVNGDEELILSGQSLNSLQIPFHIGGTLDNPRFNGEMKEVVAFDSALTEGERRLIEGYLAHKWALTNDLPESHPYKYVRPTKKDAETIDAGDIEGLTAWFDASDETTITVDDSNNVSQWDDKSENENHASQSTLSRQPMYDDTIQELIFDGGSLLSTEEPLIGEDWNIYAVFSFNSVGGVSHILSQHPSAQELGRVVYLQIEDNDTLRTFFNDGNSRILRYSKDVNLGQNYLTGSFQTGTDTYLSVNGDEELLFSESDLNSFQTPFRIGGLLDDPSFDGEMKEIVVFDDSLTKEERQIVEGYLAHKHGLTSELPSDHPYRYREPTKGDL